MKSLLLGGVLLISSFISFGAGYLFREHRLLHSGRFITSKPLALQSLRVGADPGVLPAGSVLYNYGGPNEQPYFVLFVGTKALSTLVPEPSQHWLEISPDVAASQK
jgi:hypothetical protein